MNTPLPLVILLILKNHGELTGYELYKILNKYYIGLRSNTSHQQIYRDFKKLCRAGAVTNEEVEQEGSPDKVIYTITPKGENKFLKDLRIYCETLAESKILDITGMFHFIGIYSLASNYIDGLDPKLISNIYRMVEDRKKDLDALFIHENPIRDIYSIGSKLERESLALISKELESSKF